MDKGFSGYVLPEGHISNKAISLPYKVKSGPTCCFRPSTRRLPPGPLRPYRYSPGCQARSEPVHQLGDLGRARPTLPTLPLLKTSSGVPWAMILPSCITAKQVTSRLPLPCWGYQTTVLPASAGRILGSFASIGPVPPIGSSR